MNVLNSTIEVCRGSVAATGFHKPSDFEIYQSASSTIGVLELIRLPGESLRSFIYIQLANLCFVDLKPIESSDFHPKLVFMSTSATPSSFPLLSLPQEIQDHVLSYVLGRKVVHLTRLKPEHIRYGALAHTTCELLHHFDTSLCKIEGAPMRSVKREGWCQKGCHNKHGVYGKARPARSSLRPSLAVLQTCKHLYATGTRTLYRNNVFSMPLGSVNDIEGRENSSLLEKFIRTLQPSQLPLLSKVSLILHVFAAQTLPQSIEYIGTRGWHSLHIRNDVEELRWLVGLQELSIEIQFYYAGPRLQCAKSADWTLIADALAGLRGMSFRMLRFGFRETEHEDDLAVTSARHAELARQLKAKVTGSEEAYEQGTQGH